MKVNRMLCNKISLFFGGFGVFWGEVCCCFLNFVALLLEELQSKKVRPSELTMPSLVMGKLTRYHFCLPYRIVFKSKMVKTEQAKRALTSTFL